jgi:predicted Rossmann-fold nucleotide-binding protein
VSGPLVAVFGSARLAEGDAEYDHARALGRMIGEAGWTVATGGYTVGVTIAGWPWREPNRWVREQRPGVDLFDRLRILVGQSAAMVAVAGGVGTLGEVALGWNMMQHAVRDGGSTRPLVVMGPRWRGLIDSFGEHLIDGPGDRGLVDLVDHPAEAMVTLRERIGTAGGQSS